jgi:polygalacturonase
MAAEEADGFARAGVTRNLIKKRRRSAKIRRLSIPLDLLHFIAAGMRKRQRRSILAVARAVHAFRASAERDILIRGCMRFDVNAYGAIGDGTTPATGALQAAIDAAANAGGGTVYVGSGRYVTGTLHLRSHVTLELDAGATLLGSEDPNDYPLVRSKWEGEGVRLNHAALIYGEGLENVTIAGRGTIDGRGHKWWARQRAAAESGRDLSRSTNTLRPFLFRLVDSKNILIEGVKFTNSAMWTVTPLACENVTIRNINVFNPPDSPNTDGINPESCRNVRISDCHVDVGDDCITIKSGKEDDGRRVHTPCENITITNCTLVHGHGGVVIGSEMSGSVRNVTISNCVFYGTDRGIRLKARRGRGGVVENLRVSNIVMEGVLCPIAINLFYGCGAWDSPSVTTTTEMPVSAGTPRFRHLRFSSITARKAKAAAAYILGLPEMFVEDIALSDVSIEIDESNTELGEPDMSPILPSTCRAGMIVRNVSQLSLNNVELTHCVGPALDATSVNGLRISDFAVRHIDADSPVRLEDVQNASIRGLIVPPDMTHGVNVSGSKTRSVSIHECQIARGVPIIERNGDVADHEVRFVHS